jgi:hypothetical protein
MTSDEIFSRNFYLSSIQEDEMRKKRLVWITGIAILGLIWVQGMKLAAGDTSPVPGVPPMPRMGECVISEFYVKPILGTSATKPYLALVIKLLNKTSRGPFYLRLTLVKNHFHIKTWQRLALGPTATLQVNYNDPMPTNPGQTNKYIAILSWGDPIRQPESVLDRKEAQYRRPETIIGTL